MRLGARIIKTGIAVVLSLYLAMLLDLEPLIFAALAAALAIQPSLYRSWQHVLEQLQANVIGAAAAVSFAFLLGNQPFVVGLVVVVVIAINLHFRFEKSIPLAIVTVIAIMETPDGQLLHFALERSLLILVGIASSVAVNAFFLPPKYGQKLYNQLQATTHHILSYLRSSTLHDVDDLSFREEARRLQDELIKIEQLYLLYQEERTYFRKVTYQKQRQLVLYRKMIASAKQGLALLKCIEKHRPYFAYIPDRLTQLLQDELDVLTGYHERILFKYEGKLRTPDHPHTVPHDVTTGRRQLLSQFMELYEANRQQDKEEWLHLFPLFSQLLDYADELEHLDKLVEVYYTYHDQEQNGPAQS